MQADGDWYQGRRNHSRIDRVERRAQRKRRYEPEAEGCGAAFVPFTAGHFSTRRLMISPAANRVVCSCLSSWAMACANHVRFASPALFRTAAPLAVNSIFTWRPSVGCGLRETNPIFSNAAMVGPLD